MPLACDQSMVRHVWFSPGVDVRAEDDNSEEEVDDVEEEADEAIEPLEKIDDFDEDDFDDDFDDDFEEELDEEDELGGALEEREFED